jgi:glutathione peroxidase
MNPTTVMDFPLQTIEGHAADTAPWHGRALLIVNTASACGFTPQFEGLEALWRRYRDEGLTVIGFPCNQFGRQDPGSAAEIAAFCQTRYGVSFPMMAKADVNGPAAHPLWTWLKGSADRAPGADIAWNFTKFLVGRDGRAVERFEPAVRPAEIAPRIERALNAAQATT